MFRLSYDRGTLVSPICEEGLKSQEVFPESLKTFFTRDDRAKVWRARACDYRYIVECAQNNAVKLEDHARAYEKLQLALNQAIVPRQHQVDALKAWFSPPKNPRQGANGGRGVIQLPTGAGKTILAVLAIAELKRPTLIIVPTIDLVQQWQQVLGNYLGTSQVAASIGTLGGGDRNIQPITVSTYDSALILLDKLGNKFGFLIVDECHHLPAPQYQSVAIGCIAPFRMGLSATVERADGKESVIFDLLGPLVYEGRIDELQAKTLSPYDLVSVQVPLSDEERSAYERSRALYVGFIRRAGIDLSKPKGWSEFLWKAAKLPGGREAFKAYRLQKRLAQAASGKLRELWSILLRHNDDRMIVFTDDNEMAYQIGRHFLLPVITHQTKLAERRRFLEGFRSGELSVLVTSKVLNEGVDVPEASVGVVVSGSANVREHVQRLGRILRHRPGKRAVLYELIARDTSELSVSSRRRQHHAYQGSSEIPSAQRQNSPGIS